MFKLAKKGSSATEAIEYRKAGATITPGMALTYSGGSLILATGTVVPEYISLGSATSGNKCAVKRVIEDEIYEAPLSADGSALNLGDKVTLNAADGLGVTATTTSGIFEIVEMDGTASGSMVRGLFRR